VAREELRDYRRRRDFDATPEPADLPASAPLDTEGGPDAAALRFVIQQHDATALHWDLRLEHDGVLPSWALPRGVPWSPSENHLAVRTEDHPLEYLDFKGHIPDGNYGAGDMIVYDHGTYELEKWEDKKVIVVLDGAKARGRYAIFQTRGKDWMIHRMDPAEDPTRRPIPAEVRPMQATATDTASDDDDFANEIWWPGARVLVHGVPGKVEIFDATGRNVSPRFPEVRRLHRALGAREVVLDGVICARSPSGAPSVDDAAVRERLEGEKPKSATTLRRWEQSRPVVAVFFDVLWNEGHPVTDRPYLQRRELLDALPLDPDPDRPASSAWMAPSSHPGDGEALLDAARAHGLPGLIAKRLDSVYRPGEVSPDWLAIR
jgi:bifunctional non-homologous end joining protein LigD